MFEHCEIKRVFVRVCLCVYAYVCVCAFSFVCVRVLKYFCGEIQYSTGSYSLGVVMFSIPSIVLREGCAHFLQCSRRIVRRLKP